MLPSLKLPLPSYYFCLLSPCVTIIMADLSLSGEEIEFPSMEESETQEHQLMALLVSSKHEASEMAKLMSTSPGVNFALVNSVSISERVTTFSVSLRVESAKLSELWAWLWGEKKAALMSLGLLAVVMQAGTVVWLQGIPRGRCGFYFNHK